MKERLIRVIVNPVEKIVRITKAVKENPVTIYASIPGVTTGITSVVWGEFPVPVGIGLGITSTITGTIMLTFVDRLIKKRILK